MSDTSPSKPIVELRNVEMRFGKAVVHRDISFKVLPRETVTILGPSGTGKTVILKLIAGLLHPTAGSIQVLGNEITEMNEDELTVVRAETGMLFQGAALFDSLSVYENIAYSLREADEKNEAKIAEVVERMLEVIGLPGVQNKFPPELSGGQKKRVGLARALAREPKIMLFDEPTTGLDPTAVRLIDDLIIKLKRDFGITSIVITHDIESAKRVSDRWIFINEGRVVADGPLAEVSSNNQDVVDFISGNWREND